METLAILAVLEARPGKAELCTVPPAIEQAEILAVKPRGAPAR